MLNSGINNFLIFDLSIYTVILPNPGLINKKKIWLKLNNHLVNVFYNKQNS